MLQRQSDGLRNGSSLRGGLFAAAVALITHFFASARSGLWRKLSDRTEFPVHGSFPTQQNDSLDAHFLCDAKK